MGNTNGGIRPSYAYSRVERTVNEKYRMVALCVLRRLRADCLIKRKIANDSSYNYIAKGKIFLMNEQFDKDLEFWCNAADVSKIKFKRTLVRDIELFEEGIHDTVRENT